MINLFPYPQHCPSCNNGFHITVSFYIGNATTHYPDLSELNSNPIHNEQIISISNNNSSATIDLLNSNISFSNNIPKHKIKFDVLALCYNCDNYFRRSDDNLINKNIPNNSYPLLLSHEIIYYRSLLYPNYEYCLDYNPNNNSFNVSINSIDFIKTIIKLPNSLIPLRYNHSLISNKIDSINGLGSI